MSKNPPTLIFGAVATMSSREIADLTGSGHDNVLKTVRRLAEEGVVSANETPYVHPQNGQTYTEILLSFRDTMVVVSGYSAELRAKIIDRWQELEAGAPPALNMRDPKQLVTAALQLIEVNQELQATIDAQQRQIASATPKVEALDRIAETDGLMNPTNAAKALQVQPKRVFEYMRTNGWTYRRAGGRSDVAYQDKIAAGYLTHKVHIAQREDGSERVCEQVMVTSKGLTKLAQALGAH